MWNKLFARKVGILLSHGVRVAVVLVLPVLGVAVAGADAPAAVEVQRLTNDAVKRAVVSTRLKFFMTFSFFGN